MLVFNFKKIIRMKGINKPYAYLVKSGLDGNAATKIIHNKLRLISPKVLEKICLALGCTPHDIIEWYPDKPEQKEHPLKILTPVSKHVSNIANIIRDFPVSKMEQLVRVAEEMKSAK